MDLIEKVMQVLEGEDVDEVVPMLAFLLASIAKETCNDHRVFMSYIEGVVESAYDIKRENLND
jgi:hypothetical protein